MYRTALKLACCVEGALALEIVHGEGTRKASPQESLATALLATVPSNSVHASMHSKVLSAERSRPSSKMFADEVAIKKQSDPMVLPQSERRAAQHSSPLLPASVAQAIAAIAAVVPLPALADEGTGYSKLAFGVILFSFVLTFPGIYSLVKRATKAKLKRKTYELLGPDAPGGRPVKFVAADIYSYFKAYGYKVAETTDEFIIFEGEVSPIPSRAAFLTGCVFFAALSLGLVMSILEKATFGQAFVGNFWYLPSLASPLAGKYYLENGERTDVCTVKIIVSDDDMTTDVMIQGDDEELQRFQNALDLREKGLEYVSGLM